MWGCRGSLASPGPRTVRYGGNTTCAEVRLDDGTQLILDAGTGIRLLGNAIAAKLPPTIHLLLTHLHLDHIEGLGFFAPLWRREARIEVWGPASTTMSLEERIARYFSPPLFPLQLTDIAAECTFHDVPEEPFAIGGATITAARVEHKGPTVGYRIEDNGQSLAFIPDHEPALDTKLDTASPEWVSGGSIAYGVDYLLHDAQYTSSEYGDRISWGHSRVDDAVLFARVCKADKLVLFHHDPGHGDADLETMCATAGELWGPDGTAPILAREGMVIGA